MQLTEQQKQAINWRDKESFSHNCEIKKPFGQIDIILDWCKSECRRDWRWELQEVSTDLRPGSYKFYFDCDRDFTAFLLKWSN